VNITPAAAIEMENVTTETIQLFTASIDAPEGMEVTAYEAVLSKIDENGVAREKLSWQLMLQEMYLLKKS
jgi:hypothetical protein